MTKERKHEQAQKFRRKLQTYDGRVEVIKGLASKKSFDEQDILHIKILSQKKFPDCKSVYPLLIINLKQQGMNEEAQIFQEIWFSC